MVTFGWVSVVSGVGVGWMCLNDIIFGWVLDRMLLRVGWVSGGSVVGGLLFVMQAIMACAVVGVWACWRRIL